LFQEKKCFGLDYNDLIKYVLHIFDIHPEIRLKWQERLAYIMVDEYQDIDDLQYRLMKVLCDHHKNLFVVGDPDQTIYTWRGANVRYILDFDKDFPQVQTILMMTNYRSTPQIIAVANDLIGKNRNRIKKDLLPVLPDGPPVVYHHAITAEAEAQWIAAEIRNLADKDVPLSDIVILYRAHYLTRSLETVFIKEELPYTLYSGVQFFGRMEIKDVLSYLRLIAYKDDLSFIRVANVPKRNIGERRMKFLQNYAAQNHCTLYSALEQTIDDGIFKNTKAKRFIEMIERFAVGFQERTVSELLSAVLDKSGYELMLRTEGSQERLDNLAELKQSIYEYESSCGEESSLEDYLAHVAMLTNTDAIAGKNAVKLMTVHTAKGLEFSYVFLCGLDEGIFPSKKTTTPEGMEEERRLMFVALTRAEKGLYLTDAEGRNLDGSYRFPSRFIFDIDKNLLAYTAELDRSLVSETSWLVTSSQRAMEAAAAGLPFKPGDRISHSVFGAGSVIELDRDQNTYLIKFDTLDTVRRIGTNAKLTAEAE
jgi:DNA helicase-2/ATP-dependent DNA helicase PcrA